MGDAKLKLNRRMEFLRTHPRCTYCGEAATTCDHCPPRSFFSGRHWPETYEFPACEPCNGSARLDEQALALLFRSRLTESPEPDQLEWKKLLQGVRNNQPQILAEWTSLTRNEIKHGLRQKFGNDGDLLRNNGYGLANIGTLTKAMIIRFLIKLSKALYYKHNNEIFDGVVYISNIDVHSRDITPTYINNILVMAPLLADVRRNSTSLNEQFLYRFNNSPEHGVVYAVVQFGDQFIFQLIVLNRKAAKGLIALQGQTELSITGRYECYLETI